MGPSAKRLLCMYLCVIKTTSQFVFSWPFLIDLIVPILSLPFKTWMCFAKNLHLLQATRKIHVKINHVKKLTKFVHDFRNLPRYKTEKSENQAVIWPLVMIWYLPQFCSYPHSHVICHQCR